MTTGAHQAKPDLFERLIDKAFGTNGGIAPRLPSLFEPTAQPALGSIIMEEAEHDATTTATADRSDEAPVPTAPSRMIGPDRGPPRDIAGRPAANEPAPAASPVPTIFADVPIDADPVDSALPRAATSLIAPDAGDTASDAPPPRAVAVAPFAPPVPASAPIALAQRHDSSVQGGEQADEARAAPQLVPDARVTVERVFAAPSRAAHRRQPDDRHAEPSEPQAAPSVNITIGRVEVRAVSAPAAKPRAESRGRQPLGLDEYLKRRGAR
jgi:hypothetical protein